MSALLVRKLILWSMYALALLPCMHNGLNSVCMIAFLFFCLLYNILKLKEGPANKNPEKHLFFLLVSNFILLVISLVYTPQIKEGLQHVRGTLPMLLFPFCFFLLPFTVQLKKSELHRIFIVFLAGCVLMSLWIYYRLWQQALFPRWDSSETFVTYFRETVISITHKHPTYISLYLSFAILIAMDKMVKAAGFFHKAIYLSGIFLFILLLLQLAARTPLIALFIALIVILLWKIKSFLLKSSLLITSILLFILLVRYTPAIYSRALEVKKTMFVPPVAKEYNSTNIRVGIYQCSWEVIKEHWLIGAGVGSDEKLLTACYNKIPTEAYSLQFYNTHNQYMYFWLVTGIFSLLIFISSLLYISWLALRFNDQVLMGFVIISGISLLSENILSRQAGIVFYYFFLCVMIHYHKVNRPSAILEKKKGTTIE